MLALETGRPKQIELLKRSARGFCHEPEAPATCLSLIATLKIRLTLNLATFRMRVLLVEDDWMIGESATEALCREGYAVDWVQDGEAGDTAMRTSSYDIVLLDLGLPGKDGLQVLRDLRARRIGVPVLIITARDTLEQRVEGLDAGGDDYLLKPFHVAELTARIRALLRRVSGRTELLYEFGEVRINITTRNVRKGASLVTLSGREWALIEALIAHSGAVLSRPQLEEKLYGWDAGISSNAIEVHVHALRRKLGAEVIRNVRGVGYLVPKG